MIGITLKYVSKFLNIIIILQLSLKIIWKKYSSDNNWVLNEDYCICIKLRTTMFVLNWGLRYLYCIKLKTMIFKW